MCIESWHIIGAATALAFFVLVCCIVLIVCRCWQPCGPNGTGEKASRASEANGGKQMSRQGTGSNLGLTRTITQTNIQRSAHLALARNPSEDASSGGASGALPDGWQEHEDGDNHTYFFNQLTREMSWTRPVQASFGADGGSLRSLASSAKSGGGKPTSTSAICIDHQAGLAAEHHGGAGGNGGAGAVLPTGWSEQHDEESGISYYWNAATGESSWVAPPQPGSACQPSHV